MSVRSPSSLHTPGPIGRTKSRRRAELANVRCFAQREQAISNRRGVSL
jgi:hypothetical protein